jgi:tRNA dimethylallyltransferase
MMMILQISLKKEMTVHRMNKELIVIAGPTAVGKTGLSIALAKKLNTEIISADSRQIFKELSIGTAVPSSDELSEVKHHFIQNISIHDSYNASKYEDDVNLLLEDLFRKHDRIILCGGSGLYIDAVCKGIDLLPSINPDVRNKIQTKYENEGIESLLEDLLKLDPDSFNKIDLDNPKRVQKALEISVITGKPYSSFLTSPEKKRFYAIKKLALDMNREELYERINKRVAGMINNGLIKEAKSLYPHRKINALNTVGYKELFEHFEGKLSLEDAIIKIQSNTRNYARKQLTWFKKDKNTRWFHPSEFEEIMSYIIGK